MRACGYNRKAAKLFHRAQSRPLRRRLTFGTCYMTNVRIINRGHHPLPQYATPHSAGITIALLFALIPRMGYMGAAWTTLICYASMAAISYGWGQRHYPIPYNVGRVLSYMAGAVFLWWVAEQLPVAGALNYALRSGLLGSYLWVAWRLERGNFRTSNP